MRHDYMECEQRKRYRDVFDASGERLAAGTRVERVRASEKGTDTSRYPSDIGDDDRPEYNDSEDTAECEAQSSGNSGKGPSIACSLSRRDLTVPPSTKAARGGEAWSVGTKRARLCSFMTILPRRARQI